MGERGLHLGLIMDGNGRWAQARHLPRTAGHLAGIKSLKKVVQGAINNALADVTGIEYQIVEELPPTGEKGVIYLKSNGGSGNNIYDEYIWTGTAFEKIGTTAVDLSNYWSKTDLTAIQNGDIDSIMSGA